MDSYRSASRTVQRFRKISLIERLNNFETRISKEQEQEKVGGLGAIKRLIGVKVSRRRQRPRKTNQTKLLSAKEDLTEGVCLINPYGTFKRVWETLKFLLLIYTFITLPMKVTFFSDSANEIDMDYIFEKVIDTVFLIDLILNFFTPVIDKLDLTKSHKRIAVLYLKGWFTLDLLALIPFEEIVTAAVGEENIGAFKYLVRIIKVLRLVRLVKLVRLFKSFDFKNNENYIIAWLGTNLKGTVFLLVLPNFLLIVFGVHVYSCVWYFLGESNTDNQSWLAISGFQDQSILDRYVVTFYFVLQTFTTVGYGDIPSIVNNELIFRIVIMISGVLLYSLFSGQVVEYRSNKVSEDDIYSSKFYKLQDLKRKFQLPDSLCEKVLEQIRDNRTKESPPELEFHDLSAEEINTFYYNKFITKHSGIKLFSESIEDKKFVVELGLCSKKKFFFKDQMIYEKDEPAATFFIIQSGTVEVCSSYTEHFPIIKIEGGYFGELELILNCNRMFSVKAATDVELYLLMPYDFKRLFISSADTSFNSSFQQNSLSRWKRITDIDREFELMFKRKLYWKFALKQFKKKRNYAKKFTNYMHKHSNQIVHLSAPKY